MTATLPHTDPAERRLVHTDVDGRRRKDYRDITPFDGLSGHWLLVLALTVALAAAGIVYGLQRTPTYTAQSRLAVGSIDVATNAVPGFAQAAQNLAASYARAADSSDVVKAAARRVDRPATEVAHAVSASPVPDSSVILVEGTGSSEQQAVELANAETLALRSYIQGTAKSPDESSLLDDYQRLQSKLAAARADLRDAQDVAGTATTAAVRRASARVDTLDLQARTLAAQYQNQQQNRPSSDFVRLLNDATTASSDRKQRLALFGVGGALAGLVIGLALATLLVRRQVRRLA
jgi:capsular polysaccharide biosynthesis protein